MKYYLYINVKSFTKIPYKKKKTGVRIESTEIRFGFSRYRSDKFTDVSKFGESDVGPGRTEGSDGYERGQS